MAKGIEKLVLQRFRGATTTTVLEFDPKKMVVMLFGENGTGKSTIIDAIDLVCNGSAGSIQRPSVRVKDHLPSLGATIGDVGVQLTCDGTTWNATHDGKQVRLDREEPTPVAHILRRNQLLRLIESEPGKRYEEMRRFIEVAGVEAAENALKNAVSEAKKRADSTTRLQVEAASALDELWQAETDAARGASALGWAEAKSKVDTATLSDELTRLNRRLNALQSSTTALEKCRSARRDESEATENLEAARATLHEASAGVGDGELLRLLQSAQHWLDAHDNVSQCPICEQETSTAHLQERLQQRLTALQTLQQANEDFTEVSTRHERSRSTLADAQQSLDKTLRRLNEIAPDVTLPDATQENEDVWEALHKASEQWTARRDEVQRDVNQYNAISQLHTRVLKTQSEAAAAVVLEQKLKAALEIVRKQRHDYTGKILADISAECNRLYALIHPDEPVGDLGIQLDENRRASLQQQARFQGHSNVIPQAYFSESHLDTLGFCLFLALAKYQSGENAIIVLDDVFTSVDARHLRRIVELLSSEAASFRQIIITTHYRNWRDQYRYLGGNSSAVELMELHSWSLQGGVRKSNSIYAMDELRIQLQTQPLNRQGVAALAGVLMEAALDHLALLYGCGLPRRAEGNYTLGELSDAVNKVSKHLQIEYVPANGNKARVATQIIPMKPVLDAISGLKFIRNQVGGHFNLSGGDICDADVEEFGQKSLKLLETLACPECGVAATKPKDDYFKCQCSHTRLKPLKIN